MRTIADLALGGHSLEGVPVQGAVEDGALAPALGHLLRLRDLAEARGHDLLHLLDLLLLDGRQRSAAQAWIGSNSIL